MYRKNKILIKMTCALATSLPIYQQTAHAETWPNKPIKLIVPYQVGQGTDALARHIGEALRKELGQAFIIENRPGAGGNIGTQIAKKTLANGYNFSIGTNATHAANAYLYSNIGFDAKADFEPIAMLAAVPMVYVTNINNPINTIPQMVSAAREKPDALNIAISATTYQIAHELLNKKMSTPLFKVDFRGSSQGLTALMGGQVDYMLDSVAALGGAIKNKQIKPLGVTSASSNQLLPDVPSLLEQGIADYQLEGWVMLFAPKGTQEDVLKKLSQEMNKVLSKPEIQEKILQLGMTPKIMPYEDLQDFIKTEDKKWGDLILQANIQKMN